jgi:urease accessory protein
MAEVEPLPSDSAPPIRLERARGLARIAVRADRDGRTRLDRLYQAGSAKIRLPRVPVEAPLQAILLNTAGGITGGDELTYEVVVGDGAGAVVATQAAERIYRRSAGSAAVATSLLVGAGARLDWLPQETILFDRSSLERRLTADVHQTGTLLAVEAIVLGRAAMGETVRLAGLNDVWRIRRDGRLVFADGFRFNGDATAVMAGAATGGGATAFATVILLAPDAPARLEAARAALNDSAGEAGASAWNGMLVARLLAPTSQALRGDLIRLIETLRGEAMPRVWSC